MSSRAKKYATAKTMGLLTTAIGHREWAVVHGLILTGHPSTDQLRDAASAAGMTPVEVEDDWRVWMRARGGRCVVASTVSVVKDALYRAAHPTGVTA